MGTRTKITGQGVITYKVDDTDTSPNSGFGPAPLSTTALTGTAVLTQPGVYTISSSVAGVITVRMPVASTMPGSYWVFRSLSAHAHIVSQSQSETATEPMTNGTTNGNQIALPAVIGSSVALMGDGLNYLVLGNSGTLTLT